MNAASSKIRRLAYKKTVAVAISLGGPSWTGGMARDSFEIVEWLSVRKIERRRAVDWSLELG